MLLFTPGPTPVSQKIRDAMNCPTIDHRSPQLQEIFAKCRELLKELYDMEEVLIVSCCATGAMESAMINLCHSKALIINSGKFSEKFINIAKSYNIPFTELKYELGQSANVKDIQEAVTKDDKIDAVFMEICETSTGLRNPSREISQAIKYINSDVSVVCDGRSAVGVEKIDVSNIDCLISASQQAFMLPSGLSMLGLSKDAIAKIEKNPKGFYFNLANELKKQKNNLTQFSCSVNLILGLKTRLKEMKQKGFDKIYDETKRRSIATKVALEEMNLALYPEISSDSISVVVCEKADEIIEMLKTKYEVIVAGGQEQLEGKIFRINHMGEIPPYHALWVLNAIELALDELKIRTYDGSASLAFNKIFYTK